ncbi:MAG: hypothetical protein QOE62_1859 [Actinomycetota bacterium]|nr:hypothetical protein [Actinomycetota bacterium]
MSKTDGGVAADGAARSPAPSKRASLLVFIAIEVISGAWYLIVGRRLWFDSDEWDFLAARRATSLHDLLSSHYGHWTTIPILIYRALWTLIGLHSYMPYLLGAVVTHLAVAALLRCVMRRAGVNGWTATAGAALYALFGTASYDILFGFQITFSGALALGLTHLLLADHDGPIDRRDWLGLGAGLTALLFSSIGIVMVGVVGLATLVRRGWHIALLHAAPLMSVYAIWWVSIGRVGTEHGKLDAHVAVQWIREGVSGTFSALMNGAVLGAVLGIVAAVGFVLVWVPFDFRRLRGQMAAPVALAVGGCAFFLTAAYARTSTLVGNPRAPRYEDVAAAMLLPAIAVGLDQLGRRWRYAAPVGAALLVAGIPGNVHSVNTYVHEHAAPEQQVRRLVTTLPHVPIARTVPRSVQPLPPSVTIGWLLDAAHAGRIPNPGHLSDRDIRNATFRLAFQQSSTAAALHDCEPVGTPKTLSLERGDAIGIRGWPLSMSAVSGIAGAGFTSNFNPVAGNLLVVVAGPVRVRIASRSVFLTAQVCQVSP